MDQFFVNSTLPKALLSYFITLIHNVTNPHCIEKFRPISLLAEVLANKHSKVMDSLISCNKLVFVKGGLLVDRVVVINEVVDLARRSKKECLIFKVDFEKSL
jgi:hypothetical protein